MNRTFRNARTILLAGMLLVGAISMQSQNLYVYGNDGSKQSFSLNEVRKLTFSESELLVNKYSGEPVAFAFETLQCFSLHDNLYTRIAAKPVAASKINVYTTADKVTVTSVTLINGVSLYNIGGQRLRDFQSASQEISISLVSYPAGVYLLYVADESGITVKKIIKK